MPDVKLPPTPINVKAALVEKTYVRLDWQIPEEEVTGCELCYTIERTNELSDPDRWLADPDRNWGWDVLKSNLVASTYIDKLAGDVSFPLFYRIRTVDSNLKITSFWCDPVTVQKKENPSYRIVEFHKDPNPKSLSVDVDGPEDVSKNIDLDNFILSGNSLSKITVFSIKSEVRGRPGVVSQKPLFDIVKR